MYHKCLTYLFQHLYGFNIYAYYRSSSKSIFCWSVLVIFPVFVNLHNDNDKFPECSWMKETNIPLSGCFRCAAWVGVNAGDLMQEYYIKYIGTSQGKGGLHCAVTTLPKKLSLGKIEDEGTSNSIGRVPSN